MLSDAINIINAMRADGQRSIWRFGGKLYGPYHHGGRSYFQWMARGEFLRDTLIPLLDTHLHPGLDQKSFGRYSDMKANYHL